MCSVACGKFSDISTSHIGNELRRWVLYAAQCTAQEAAPLFLRLWSEGVGRHRSLLYRAWAQCLESCGEARLAHEIFLLGKRRQAEPRLALTDAHEGFLLRHPEFLPSQTLPDELPLSPAPCRAAGQIAQTMPSTGITDKVSSRQLPQACQCLALFHETSWVTHWSRLRRRTRLKLCGGQFEICGRVGRGGQARCCTAPCLFSGTTRSVRSLCFFPWSHRSRSTHTWLTTSHKLQPIASNPLPTPAVSLGLFLRFKKRSSSQNTCAPPALNSFVMMFARRAQCTHTLPVTRCPT